MIGAKVQFEQTLKRMGGESLKVQSIKKEKSVALKEKGMVPGGRSELQGDF